MSGGGFCRWAGLSPPPVVSPLTKHNYFQLHRVQYVYKCLKKRYEIPAMLSIKLSIYLSMYSRWQWCGTATAKWDSFKNHFTNELVTSRKSKVYKLWISWYTDNFKMVLEAVPFSCRCPTSLSSTVHVDNQLTATCQEIYVFWWNNNWNVRHDMPIMISKLSKLYCWLGVHKPLIIAHANFTETIWKNIVFKHNNRHSWALYLQQIYCSKNQKWI